MFFLFIFHYIFCNEYSTIGFFNNHIATHTFNIHFVTQSETPSFTLKQTCYNTSYTCYNTSYKCYNTSYTCYNTSYTCYNTSNTCYNTSYECYNTMSQINDPHGYLVSLRWLLLRLGIETTCINHCKHSILVSSQIYLLA